MQFDSARIKLDAPPLTCALSLSPKIEGRLRLSSLGDNHLEGVQLKIIVPGLIETRCEAIGLLDQMMTEPA